MGVLLGLVAVFGIAIALAVKIGYNKNEMDIPYKFFNVCGVLCMVYTFIKWWLIFIAMICFGLAFGIKKRNEDKDEKYIYGPIKKKW